ncbi:MAG: hypothetical protein RML45_16285 [Acetobacteraceae bacterium]|nr:hypothetical protein [Acetobacteraceae bacterium]
MRTTGLIALVSGAAMCCCRVRRTPAWVQWTGAGATNNWYRFVEDTSERVERGARDSGADASSVATSSPSPAPAEQSFVSVDTSSLSAAATDQ